MKEIIENLALIHLNEFGRKNGIYISGTHLVKNGRGFTYSLCKNETGLAIVSVTFNKASVPNYSINRV